MRAADFIRVQVGIETRRFLEGIGDFRRALRQAIEEDRPLAERLIPERGTE